jgi:FKBP-type peptidyl-prolyl cis-trans isomerase FkpA
MATATWGCGKLGRMKIPSPVLLGWLLASACATTSPTPAAATDASTQAAPPSSSAQGSQPQTDEQKTLYALGLSVGRSLSVFNLTNEELEYVRAGIYAQAKGETPAVDITTWGPKIQGLAVARQAARAGGEKEKGKAYQDKAAQEPGAVKTSSGLIYIETQPGSGPSPKAEDVVKVHYRGMTVDGKEFDNSYKRGEPATFPINGVIRCWTEGLQRMKVGGKARFVCPSDLAYGDRGAPPDIRGGATLVFEVELLELTPGP